MSNTVCVSTQSTHGGLSRLFKEHYVSVQKGTLAMRTKQSCSQKDIAEGKKCYECQCRSLPRTFHQNKTLLRETHLVIVIYIFCIFVIQKIPLCPPSLFQNGFNTLLGRGGTAALRAGGVTKRSFLGHQSIRGLDRGSGSLWQSQDVCVRDTESQRGARWLII